MKDSKETSSNICNDKFFLQLKHLTVLSVTLPALLVPLLAIGISSIGKAEEFKPKQLIAQSCRNIEIRTNGKSRTFGRGTSATVCGYKFNFQRDGNLVLTNQSGQVLWATGTEGRGQILSIQADGNFVVYGGGGALWATNTSGNYGAFLAIQTDGNLVMYRSDGRQALWASNTDSGQFRTRNASGWSGGGQSPVQVSQPSQRESQRKVAAFVGFANGQRGIRRYDISGSDYDGQCVTLVARYLQEHYGASRSNLSLDHGRGTAASVGRQFSNSFLPLSDPSDPIPGSIISFPQIGGGYGHVALVVSSQRSGENLNIQILDSNGDGAGSNSVVTLRNLTVNTRSLTAQGYGGSIQWVNPRD
ncbi:CHAP domain-containing protein [Chamaesiphon sp. VAR_69_metabat_338]|uniref:CHAP domain-containing protein n=1 Tax=Chamaesiphon sp. VAR_69_metabat_338 TaxID=2964704 RepID=UPI00286E7746|nr:CHAP domain-containing protein [Chamaesiphon sp. VAR_69_metabat_338]